MVQENAILWIDLETTGSSNDADIIEFGAVLTDSSPELNQLGEFTATLSTTKDYESPIVEEMHERSGLTIALDNPDFLLVSSLEQAVLRWINDTIGFSTEHIAWGGSGVGHIDSKYIRRDMPYLSKRITYWVYDVGVLRRMLRLAGVEFKDTTEAKTHRALDDIKGHVQEARDYISILRNSNAENISSP
jgi:oligoribonuclease (3'-5' exoribonuclease)